MKKLLSLLLFGLFLIPCAFAAVSYEDTYNRANSATVGGSWTEDGTNTGWTIDTNTLYHGSGTTRGTMYQVLAANDTYFCSQINFTSPNTLEILYWTTANRLINTRFNGANQYEYYNGAGYSVCSNRVWSIGDYICINTANFSVYSANSTARVKLCNAAQYSNTNTAWRVSYDTVDTTHSERIGRTCFGDTIADCVPLTGVTVNNTFTVNVVDLFNNTGGAGFSVKFYNQSGLITTKTTNSAGQVTLSKAQNIRLNYTVERAGYYNITSLSYGTAAPNVTNTSYVYQARYSNFTAYNKVSGSKVSTPFNISVRNGGRRYVINGSTVYVYVRPGTINFTFDKNGTAANSYYPKNFSKSVAYWTNSGNPNVTGVYNAKLNVTAINNFTSADITTFTGWVSNSTYGFNESYTTTTSKAILNLTPGRYLVHIDAPGYSENFTEKYFVVAPLSNQVQFQLYSGNSVIVTYRRESDGALITSNITIVISSNSSENTYYSNNDSVQMFSNLTDGEYTFKFSSSIYSLRMYVVTVAMNSTQLLTAYLTPSNSTVLFTVIDQNSLESIPDATVGMYRFVNGSYSLVESHNTDITGKLEFLYTFGTKYAFLVSKTGYADKAFTLDPILFSSYDIYLERTTTETESYNDVYFYFTPKTFYKNHTSLFTILFNSEGGVLSNYWFNISYPGNSSEQSGSNANGGSFNHLVNASTALIFDTVNITVNYTTIFGESSQSVYRYSIIGVYGHTIIANKDNYYNLTWFERVLVGTIIIIIAVGLTTMVAGVVAGAGFGIIISLLIMYLGLLPYIAGIFMVLALIFIVTKRIGET